MFTSRCLFLNPFWRVGAWGEVFFVSFFEGSWKHGVHPQPSKTDGHIHNPQPSKQKKSCLQPCNPATLKKQKKLVPTPTILQNPKKMMFSHSPLPSKNFFKKKDLYSPPTIKKRDLYSNPLKKPKKENWG